ncbi:acyltransferase family protein [Planctomycetales bacterium ZRK34]|nr:acyltransferase family protein [Planctomycetales bacterium ZRK34]
MAKPTPSLTAGSTRLAYVDYAKGIGITLVVFGHALRGLDGRLIEMNHTVWQSVDIWIYSFHMPLFFYLAGLFVERSVKSRSSGRFVLDRIKVLMYPYFVWGLLQSSIQIVTPGTRTETSWTQLWRIVYLPPAQYWFLYALFILSVFYLLARRMKLTPLVFAIGSIILFVFGRWMFFGSWIVLHLACGFLIYFALGTWIGSSAIIQWPLKLRAEVLAMITGLGFLTVTLMMFVGQNEAFGVTAAICGTLACVTLAELASRGGRTFGFLRSWGQLSLEIYVAHTIFSAAVRILMTRIGIVNVPTHLVVGTLVGLLAPWALASVCYRMGWYYVFTLLPARVPGVIAAKNTAR